MGSAESGRWGPANQGEVITRRTLAAGSVRRTAVASPRVGVSRAVEVTVYRAVPFAVVLVLIARPWPSPAR
ncbi:hypothetical protein ABIA38_005697 [Embleya sp. AB8]